MCTLSIDYVLVNDACSDAEPYAQPVYVSIETPEGYGFMDVDKGDSVKDIREFIESFSNELRSATLSVEPGLVTYTW